MVLLGTTASLLSMVLLGAGLWPASPVNTFSLGIRYILKNKIYVKKNISVLRKTKLDIRKWIHSYYLALEIKTLFLIYKQWLNLDYELFKYINLWLFTLSPLKHGNVRWNHQKWLQILVGKAVNKVQIDPQTTNIWSTDLTVTLSMSEGVSLWATFYLERRLSSKVDLFLVS